MRNIRLLTTIGALFYVALGISSPLITLFLEELGASFAHISLILTTFTATALLTNYASGFLADRLGRRKPLLIAGLLLLATTYWLLGRAANANLAWWVRVLEGIGLGTYSTVSLTLMGDLLEGSAQKGRRMGFFRGIGSLAFALGAFGGGWLADLLSIPGVFTLAAGFYLAGALTALGLAEVASPPRPVRTATALTPGTPAVAPPALPWLFLAGALLWTMALSSAASMWPNAMSALGYSKQAIGSLWGLAALVEFPAMQLAGILSDQMGRVPLLAAGGFGVSLVMVGYFLAAQYLPALVATQGVRGLAYGTYLANAMTYATEHSTPANRGSTSGLYNAVTSAGQLLGMLTGGLVVQVAGFSTLFLACAGIALLSGLCFVALRR